MGGTRWLSRINRSCEGEMKVVKETGDITRVGEGEEEREEEEEEEE